MLNAVLFSCLLACCVSCATSPIKDASEQHQKLFAEHRAMKKRLPLVERENDVLTKENQHYQKWVRDLEDKINALSDALADAKEKYAREITAKNEHINQIEMSMQQLDQEKTEQIAALNKTMVTQKHAFIAQRKQIIEDKKKQKAILSSQLADKEKELETKTQEIDLLASAKKELENALENNALEISKLVAAKADLENALENKTRQLTELAAANQKNQEKINDTSEMIASLKKARDKSMAELESQRAANADLVKTFNELFKELQLKKDESGTQI